MSEDVSRFLSQVKELGERRLEEDEARSRELEEKILQDRKERQARRRERARSISPQKSSPVNTPPPSQPNDSHRLERLDLAASPILYPPSSPQSQVAPKIEDDTMAAAVPLPTSPSKENDSPLDAEIKPNHPPSPTRNGTARGLSWQRRPNSQAPERSRSRPLSMVAAENATRSSNSVSEPETTADNPSRAQIASALSSKDASWFRQTADRGASSAAYRRNQVEDTQTVDLSSAQTQLPGMSRSASGELFKNVESPLLESPALRNTVTSPTSLSDAPKLDPLPNTIQSDADLNQETRGPRSPPPGRASPTRAERPVSPTKGMGGFVQSAMMKRSESVSKRWNVQSPTVLQRADPVASNRNSFDPTNRMNVGPKVRPTSMFREASTEPARPTSSGSREEDRPASRASASLQQDTTASPEPQGPNSSNITPPVSPSKTMDPRRWSPQKSSWLESALNKPESPKPKPTQHPPSQPAWMAELQKVKAQKASNTVTESGSKSPAPSHKHQVSIGGLLRSSAPGVTTTPPVGRRGLHSPSHSISTISAPLVHANSSESHLPIVPEPMKSRSKSIADIKQAALPPVDKVKPATPPKKDFRASLKPRAPTISTPTSSEGVEFKNVFGNLRKATQQNYVAPDELKDNITKGKAALAVTGGPQKSERVDEFKEAILAKKKAFQAAQSEGRSITRNNSVSTENPVPEGLLKRAELGRSNTIKRGSVSSDIPGAASRQPSAVPQRDAIPGNFAGRFERFSNLEKRSSTIETPNPNLEGQATSMEPLNIRKLSFPRPANGSMDKANEPNGPARLPGKLASGGLANRFNPALAGLLSRGPPPMTSNSGPNPRGPVFPGSKVEVNDNEPGAGPKLTHMTKNRARGPKRKAPIKSAPPTTTTQSKPTATEGSPMPSPVLRQGSGPSSAPAPTTFVNPLEKEPIAPLQPRPKPVTLTSASRIVTVGKFTEEPQQIPSQSSSPGKLNIHRMSVFMDSAPTADKKFDSEQTKPLETPRKPKSFLDKTPPLDAQQKPQPRSPSLNKPKVPLPTPSSLPPRRQSSKIDSEAIDAGSETEPVGPSGLRPLPTPPATTVSGPSNAPVRPLPKEPERSPRPLSSLGTNSPTTTAFPIRSPTKQSLDTSVIIRDFFGSDRPPRNYRVDTVEILSRRPSSAPPKIQTLSARLFHFLPDGKKQPVPAHHERTLFERDMYLCTHSFNDNTRKSTLEVYLWAGVDVPESIVQEATIFAAREARSLGGALIKLQQGKETPEFLQALGGIVITHCGSGSKYDSLAPHMLCGRRYHGHVVFDEVDFASSVLCSGFPYIIAQGGRCYLWKGKGSGIDELGCARLIGMDYALSGELEELEEGRESDEFWNLFGGATRFGSADHWRLKPSYDKYCSRLFLSDATSRQQVTELPIFAQADMLPTNIYVIDAFFELYIVVGSRAQDQYTSFHNALDFAQEYAILAASMEDRPFVPVSTVVLEGIPRDMKSVFRKWQDALSPTVTNANAGLKRGRSLKVVSLSQALQALTD